MGVISKSRDIVHGRLLLPIRDICSSPALEQQSDSVNLLLTGRADSETRGLGNGGYESGTPFVVLVVDIPAQPDPIADERGVIPICGGVYRRLPLRRDSGAAC